MGEEEKAKGYKMSKKKDFLWRYQPPINSDKAKMLSYIQNQSLHPFEDKTTMIITALNAYYRIHLTSFSILKYIYGKALPSNHAVFQQPDRRRVGNS